MILYVSFEGIIGFSDSSNGIVSASRDGQRLKIELETLFIRKHNKRLEIPFRSNFRVQQVNQQFRSFRKFSSTIELVEVEIFYQKY